jgi:hypothetical protein
MNKTLRRLQQSQSSFRIGAGEDSLTFDSALDDVFGRPALQTLAGVVIHEFVTCRFSTVSAVFVTLDHCPILHC